MNTHLNQNRSQIDLNQIRVMAVTAAIALASLAVTILGNTAGAITTLAG